LADSRTRLKIEKWIREVWLPQKYEQEFSAEHLQLSSGGYFDFDAVSADGTIVASISTSSARTRSGRRATGKIHKLRGDMLFLLMVQADKRIIVLSEKDMCDYLIKEKDNGRVPPEIEFVHASIPEDLKKELNAAKKIAAQEVMPGEHG
jgi:hypothetical protein